MPNRVTEFVAHYTQPQSSEWTDAKANWNEHALQAWLDAAQQRGLEVTVREVRDSHDVIAVVEVDGREYAVTHLGRRMELQAEPR